MEKRIKKWRLYLEVEGSTYRSLREKLGSSSREYQSLNSRKTSFGGKRGGEGNKRRSAELTSSTPVGYKLCISIN